MPTISTWVAPEVFMTHNGVVVYRTYEDDDFDQASNGDSYTTDNMSDGGEYVFNVHELDVPSHSGLDAHPPFLCNTNPDWATASDETKQLWKQQWEAWFDGGEELAIKTVIKEAIDLGLIRVPTAA